MCQLPVWRIAGVSKCPKDWVNVNVLNEIYLFTLFAFFFSLKFRGLIYRVVILSVTPVLNELAKCFSKRRECSIHTCVRERNIGGEGVGGRVNFITLFQSFPSHNRNGRMTKKRNERKDERQLNWDRIACGMYRVHWIQMIACSRVTSQLVHHYPWNRISSDDITILGVTLFFSLPLSPSLDLSFHLLLHLSHLLRTSHRCVHNKTCGSTAFGWITRSIKIGK